jgi:hypothetical protein
MLRRRLSLVRAWSAAGLLSLGFLGATAPAAEPSEPMPGAEADTHVVGILDAQKSGELAVKVRGQGEAKVHFTLENTSARRLNVVLPPGLVAASTTGQLQSMGLGAPGNGPGAFGGQRSVGTEGGLRSINADNPDDPRRVAVPAGQKVEFTMPAVCLNFGKPTPTPRDSFRLVDVADYSTDPRVRKALRSLSTYGTSLGVAQAVMWHLCNGLPFEAMVAQSNKLINSSELALAMRVVEAVNADSTDDLLDPAYFHEGRVFVRVRGESKLAEPAARLAGELDGLRLFGLPARVVPADESPVAQGPALLLEITLTGVRPGQTEGRVAVGQTSTLDGGWTPLGRPEFTAGSAPTILDGPELARTVERAVASTFVTVKPAHRSVGRTTLRIENRLPFTVTNVVVKAGRSSGSPTVTFEGLGIGPRRAALAPIQAAGATVELVEFNGL